MASEGQQEVRAGRDAVVAGGNVINYYLDPAADAGALGELSAGEGAKLLRELARADDSLNRARKVLTGVPADVALPALKVLLRRDEELAIALLATINEARAASLVSALGPAGTELQTLAEAVEAVTQCESAEHKALGERAGRFTRVASKRGTPGYRQVYAAGAIHWSPDHGAHATTGDIARCHEDAGGVTGLLGFPVTAAASGKHPDTGTECSWQLFEGPADYSSEVRALRGLRCGATIVSSPKHGTHATWGAVGDLAERTWREWGQLVEIQLRQASYAPAGLALPVEDLTAVGPSQRRAKTTGWRQRFESGAVYFSEKTGAIRVPNPLADYLEDQGGAAGPLGFPVSPLLDAARSPYGTKGYFQRFEGLWDYPGDIVSRWRADERPGGATIYYSTVHGIFSVERDIGVLYERMNGTASWLGFPTADESASWAADGTVRATQLFEGGAIVCGEGRDPVAVKREILSHLAQQPYRMETLGFPAGEAQPLASADGDYIQFFERAVVTVRDGQVQVWWLSPNPATTKLPPDNAQAHNRYREARKAAHCSGVSRRMVPSRSLESRTARPPSGSAAISTQLAWLPPV